MLLRAGRVPRFPRPRLKRKPQVTTRHASRRVRHASVVIHIGIANVPGIPGACATHNFAYLVRDPRQGSRIVPPAMVVGQHTSFEFVIFFHKCCTSNRYCVLNPYFHELYSERLIQILGDHFFYATCPTQTILWMWGLWLIGQFPDTKIHGPNMGPTWADLGIALWRSIYWCRTVRIHLYSFILNKLHYITYIFQTIIVICCWSPAKIQSHRAGNKNND